MREFLTEPSYKLFLALNLKPTLLTLVKVEEVAEKTNSQLVRNWTTGSLLKVGTFFVQVLVHFFTCRSVPLWSLVTTNSFSGLIYYQLPRLGASNTSKYEQYKQCKQYEQIGGQAELLQ